MWAYDFVFDPTAGGQQIKCLTVIDEYRRVFGNRRGGSIRSNRLARYARARYESGPRAMKHKCFIA